MNPRSSSTLLLTLGGLFASLLAYPATVSPTGPGSGTFSGNWMGISAMFIAALLFWTGYLVSPRQFQTKYWLLLPAAIISTFILFADATIALGL